jgi:hypothetical protein
MPERRRYPALELPSLDNVLNDMSRWASANCRSRSLGTQAARLIARHARRSNAWSDRRTNWTAWPRKTPAGAA